MSNLYTFKGGALVPSYSAARNAPITTPEALASVVLPMPRGVTPTVSVGDEVLRGQLIADGEGALPVYSSVSGRIESISVGDGATAVISNDERYAVSETCLPHPKKLSETTPDEIIDKVRRLALLTDSGEPLFEILKSGAQDTRRFILNAASDGAYSAVNYRIAIEKADEVIGGAKIIMRALGVVKTDVVFGEDDTDAANALSQSVAKSNLFGFYMLKMKYPRAHERLIVSALTGRELTHPLTALDAGYVILTPRACADVFAAFATGMPSVNTYVGVDGDAVKRQCTLCVPRGTSYRAIVDACGGLADENAAVSVGAGLVGEVVADRDAPLLLPVCELLVSVPSASAGGECINCGRCAAACPMRLMPMLLMAQAKRKKHAGARRLGLDECIGCGACDFVCPEKLHISRFIADAKRALWQNGPDFIAEKGGADGE